MKIRPKWQWTAQELSESAQELDNPARGWYQIYTFLAQDSIDPQELRWSLREGETLALVLIDIQAYQDRPLEETALDHIRSILSFFMEYQKDVILRPVYDREGKGREREPEDFALVLTHAKQLGELLQTEKHSVWMLQGLLVGSWGEMHDTRYASPRHFRALQRTLEPYLKPDICLAVRTPAIWRMLTEKDACMQGKYENRTVFDDGILGSPAHLGTFGTMTEEAAGWEQPWNRKEELVFLQRLTRKMPCGGEVVTDVEGRVIEPKDTVRELETMHLTYLNCVHDGRVLDTWKDQIWEEEGVWNGCSLYDYIGRHLGYRLTVRKAEEKRCLSGRIRLEIEMENTGFGTPFQEMECFLTVQPEGKSRGTARRYPIALDARTCYPGEKRKAAVQFTPQEGNVYLELRRKKDGRRIHFANEKSGDSLLLGSLHRNEKERIMEA